MNTVKYDTHHLLVLLLTGVSAVSCTWEFPSAGIGEESSETGTGESDGDGDGDQETGDGDGNVCGDGIVGPLEECDDGNEDDQDNCSNECKEAFCGDGLVQVGVEECDDGDQDDTDECLIGCVSATCGDGVVWQGEEDCDDENDDNKDGCVQCTEPETCLDILMLDAAAEDGEYSLWPEPGVSWVTSCDMAGGGWTAINLEDTCGEGVLDAELVVFEEAQTAGIVQLTCQPYTQDDDNNGHVYALDITFPPGFEEFYLDEYMIKGNPGPGDQSEISSLCFKQSTWNVAYGCKLQIYFSSGDVSFGSADEDGPVVSFASETDVPLSLKSGTAPQPFPGDGPYEVDPTSTFRIGWGEGIDEVEGWFPWYSGTIYVR